MLTKSVLLLFCYFISMITTIDIGVQWDEDDDPGTLYNVDAVLGRSATLPCNIEPEGREDRVYMVLWFRETSPKPMYSFDVRGRAFTKALHWSDPRIFGPRAYFVTISKPATLNLDSVQLDDEGIYRCRVDFKNSPSRSVQINLSVIVPPHQLLIYDNSGHDVTGIIGPLEEDVDLILVCEVRGGRPAPTLSWFINDKIVEGPFDVIGNHVLVSRLEIPKVKRAHLNSTYRCQASNTKLMMPIEKAVRLELLLKPLSVRIMQKPKLMDADLEVMMTCEVIGSRPMALISWYQENHKFIRGKVEEVSNETITQSILKFIPTPDDDNTAMKCVGENPQITGGAIEDIFKLNIVYSPKVNLKLGSTLNPSDIKEGDDVYFECSIRANPKHHRITWYHNDVVVVQNVSLGIIISTHSLVLQRVLRGQSGSYKCQAVNTKGESTSEAVQLKVKYAPVCKTNEVVTIGATFDEVLRVQCYVNADPLDVRFFWQFNNSVENFDISSARFSSTDADNAVVPVPAIGLGTAPADPASYVDRFTNLSELIYTPASQRDFGTLSCWGTNSIGRQIEPCFFHIVPAARPSPVKNCTLRTITNRSNDALEVECDAGFDGGLPQTFFMEVYESETSILRLNLTNLQNVAKPIFRFDLEDLASNEIFSDTLSVPTFYLILYAGNAKGSSETLILENIALKDAEKRTDGSSTTLINMVPLTALVSGAFLTLFLVMLLVVIMTIRKCRKEHRLTGNLMLSNSRCLLENNCKERDIKASRNKSHESVLEVNSCDNLYVVAYTLKQNVCSNNQIKQSPDILHTPRATMASDVTNATSILKSNNSTTINEDSVASFQKSRHCPFPTDSRNLDNFDKTASLDRPKMNHHNNNAHNNNNNNNNNDNVKNVHFGTLRKESQRVFTDTLPGPESCV